MAGNKILRARMFGVAAGTAGSWFDSLPVFWRAQLVGWTLFFVLDAVNRLLTYHNWAMAIVVSLVVWPCLILLSTGLGAIYSSRKIGNPLTPGSLALIGLLAGCAALIVVAVGFITRQIAGWTMPNWTLLDQIAVPWFHYVLALGAWSLCYFWIQADRAKQDEHRHAMHAEAEALRLELEELRLQLDPHFLFNALNGVAEEIPEHPQAALAMLRDLTGYLRHSLDGINQTVVTVDAEVGGLMAYLGVQKARFGERLRTHVQVSRDAGDRHIASFLLQPLVENAVKHGRRDNGLDVQLDIGVEGDGLHVMITNTGTLEEANASRRRRPGIGLENVRRRLALLYPGRHAFTMEGRDDKVVKLQGEPCPAS